MTVRGYPKMLTVIAFLLFTFQCVSGTGEVSDSTQQKRTVVEEFSAGYYFDTFSKPYNRFWQIYSAGGGIGLPFGPLMTTVNYGIINKDASFNQEYSDYQLLAETYPTITDKLYGYLAYGISPGQYFPDHRASMGLWYSLQKGWVISGGTNYYRFDQNIFVPYVALEKYSGRYWFSSKVNIHNKQTGLTASILLSARRYLNDTDYIQLSAGSGTAPDEPFNIMVDNERQRANMIKILFNKSVGNNLIIRSGLGYSREEYAAGLERNRTEAVLSITIKPKGIR